MDDDIATAIRRTVGRVETYEHTPLMAVALSAADEIERLRAVIAAIDRMDMRVVDLAFKEVEALRG